MAEALALFSCVIYFCPLPNTALIGFKLRVTAGIQVCAVKRMPAKSERELLCNSPALLCFCSSRCCTSATSSFVWGQLLGRAKQWWCRLEERFNVQNLQRRNSILRRVIRHHISCLLLFKRMGNFNFRMSSPTRQGNLMCTLQDSDRKYCCISSHREQAYSCLFAVFFICSSWLDIYCLFFPCELTSFIVPLPL